MASGDVLGEFTPASAEFPASNSPGISFRNAHPCLDFDASTEESAFFTGSLRPYGGGGATVRIFWCATSATSGDVKWGAAFERIDDGGQDTDADSFASDQTVTSTAPGTSGVVKYSEITLTNGAQMDSVANGELYRLRIKRVAADAADTMTGDAQIMCIQIRET